MNTNTDTMTEFEPDSALTAKKGRKTKALLFAVLCLVSTLAAFGIGLYILNNCAVSDATKDRESVMLLDPTDTSDTFRDSPQFYERFYSDITDVTNQLAIAMQMESNGSYDGNKLIDIVEFYYRKKNNIPEKYKDIHIQYRMSDLIDWCAGNDMFWQELDYDTWKDASGARTDAENLSEYRERSFSYVDELYLPADGVSIYQREYPGGIESVFANDRIKVEDDGEYHYETKMNESLSIAGILSSVANDLYNNYQNYLHRSSRFTTSQNLKFVLFDGEGRIRQSNVVLADSFMDSERTSRNDTLRKAFRKQKAYIDYRFADDSLSSGKVKGRLPDLKAQLAGYKYAFDEGSELLVCVLDERTDDELLGNYVSYDLYAYADEAFYKATENTSFYLFLIVVLLLTALVSFVIFTVFIPGLPKEDVKGFHKIPTLLAAMLLMALGGIVALPPLIVLESYGARGIMLLDGNMFTYFLVLCFVCGLFEMAAFLYGWYSLVLRIKSRTVFSDSLCACIIRGSLGMMEKSAGFMQKRKSVLLRSTLPYVCFLLINLFVLAASNMSPEAIIALLLVLDIPVGVALYLKETGADAVASGIGKIIDGDLDYQIDSTKMFDGNKLMALQVNQIGDTVHAAVERSMQDERMKTELVTNVSHDIKTPLTSVITYVDLLKQEDIPGEQAREYIRILDEKSQRLKVLINDLVEASKISSGTITLEKEHLDMREMVSQILGEFEDKLQASQLSVIYERPEEAMDVFADPARLWRVLENLTENVCKYAMPGSRVYIDLTKAVDEKDPDKAGTVVFSMKNVSAMPLSVSSNELMERFVRGDVARSSEGSGLGLSIARDLTKLMGGEFSISMEADLFKVTLEFAEQ